MVLSHDFSVRENSNTAAAMLKGPKLEDHNCPYMDGYLKYRENLSRIVSKDAENVSFDASPPNANDQKT